MCKLYLIFQSTHETLKAELTLLRSGLTCKVVMKPAAIRLDCGLAVRIDEASRPAVDTALREAGIRPRGAFAV